MKEFGSPVSPGQLIATDMAAIRSQSVGWVSPEFRMMFPELVDDCVTYVPNMDEDDPVFEFCWPSAAAAVDSVLDGGLDHGAV